MLINCVVYREGARLTDIPVRAISDHVGRDDCFIWVALCDASAEELAQMQDEFNLHSLAVEDAHHGHQRPKIEEYGDSLFVVMHLLDIDGEEFSRGEIAVFIATNYVLSVRSGSAQDFRSVRQRCEREPHLLRLGAGFVLYALMDAVVDRYFPLVEVLENELENIEEQIFTKGAARSNIQGLYALKRKVTVLRHAVTPLMEAVGRLIGGRIPQVCVGSQEYLRDVFDHLVRLNVAIDTIRDTIATAIQVNLSMIAIEDSEVNKRLAAWAGIFAMATAFAGIWGMNFREMPELHWEYGYPLALCMISGTCLILYWRLKRAGWL